MCGTTICVLLTMVVMSVDVAASSSNSLRENAAAASRNTAANQNTAAERGARLSGGPKTTTNKKTFDLNDPLVKSITHEATPFLTNIQTPSGVSTEIANANPNTMNMLKSKNQCLSCQKFFDGVVFPKLISGTPACQPKDVRLFGSHGDGLAFKGFCQLWTARVHGEQRGSLKMMVKDLVTQDGTLGTDPSCSKALAFDACVDMGQCTETPCEVCQDRVSMAATLALNSNFKGVSPVMERLETMCTDGTNPEIAQARKKTIKAAKDNAAFLRMYQDGYNQFNAKKIQDDSGTSKTTIQLNPDETCASLSSVNYAKEHLQQAEMQWGKQKPTPPKVKAFCTAIGFCRDDDKVKIPNECQLPEETITANDGVHEGATENWVKHDVAKKLTYKFMGKVSQKGQQTRQIKTNKEKTEEQKNSWVTADVVIRTSGRLVDGMARFEVQVDNAQIGTYDSSDKWTPRDLAESDFPYFFSRNANGQVTHIHHDPAEKYFALQLKHEIAKMFSTDLKGDELFGKASTSFAERGESGAGGGSVQSKHQTTVLMEKTATHVVVRKTRSGISHHKVFAGQGDGRSTLHHRGEATIVIDKTTGDIEKSTKQDHVQTETDEMLDDNKKGPGEKCDRTRKDHDRTCTSQEGGPRAESVDASSKESLRLVNREVYQKNSHGAQTIGNFLETSMRRMKTVSLWDEGHLPSRAEQQEEIHQHLKHPNAQLPTSPKLSKYVDYLLTEKSGDRNHRTFATLVDIVSHRPDLVKQLYKRAAAMVGNERELAEYSRIVNVLAAGGTVPAQRALLALLGDKEGKTEYQRHVALNALGFTKYGAHSDVVDALKHMVFNVFGNQTRQNVALTDPIAAFAPVTLATVVHFRHHIGHVDPAERKRTMELQDALEKHAQVALVDSHPNEHKLVWINALGNTGRNSSLPIISQYLQEHRAGQYQETKEHNEVVRAASVMALRQIPGNHSEDLITSHLWDPSPKVREAAANVYASSHRKAGEGTAEKLHHAWLHEKNNAVLSLLEQAKTKAGECNGCDTSLVEASETNVIDEIAIPYTKQWLKKFGSNPNYLGLTSGFKLQFVAPFADAKAGLVMHTTGNDFMILGVGIQAGPACVNKKTKTRIIPYAIIFNQEIAIPLSKDPKKQAKLGKCDGDDDGDVKPKPKRKTAKEIVAEHNKKKAEHAAKKEAFKVKKAQMGGKSFKKNKIDSQGKDTNMGGGAGGNVFTPTCGMIELMDVWSQEITAPPSPLGRFMTAVGPVILTIEIKVVFTIGLEGQVSSCGGGDFEKLPAIKGSQCKSENFVLDEKDCFGDAIEAAGVSPEKAIAVTNKNLPKGCSFHGPKKTIYFNYAMDGKLPYEDKGTQCKADGLLYNCKNPKCNQQRSCSSDSSLKHCACPADLGWCKDQERTYKVVIGKSFGALPKAYQNTWTKTKCDTLVGDYNWCKKKMDDNGVVPGKSWGALLEKKTQTTWTSKKCDSVLTEYDDSAADYNSICTVDEKDNKRASYEFMGAIAPYFSIGLEVKASVGYPFIIQISVQINIDFFKLQPVTTLTASTGRDDAKDTPAMISAGDFYVHLLAGSVGITLTFLPDIFDIEIELIKIKFPGPNGKYVCVQAIGTAPCPDEYFINAPGGADSILTLSTFPVSLWCTESPSQKTMCPWREGRALDDDAKADQSLNLDRGKCKQSYHCQAKDFDGNVMSDTDSITTHGTGIHWNSKYVFRDRSNYRPESDHQKKWFNSKFGTELVAGVDRPIQSYVMFEAKFVSNSISNSIKDWCVDKMIEYNVKPLKSFGSLPKSYQTKWNNDKCNDYVRLKNSCGRVVLRGKTSDWNDAYVFSFGGVDGKSSIAKGKLSGNSIVGLTDKVSQLIPEFNACNPDESLPFWVRVDTFGHAAMGTGGKVGVNTLLQWKEKLVRGTKPIQWVRMAGFGSSSSLEKIQFTKVEVNRGYKDEVYCYPTNEEEDPDHKDYMKLGHCYRKMPDSYHQDNNVRTNPQKAPQLKCNKGNSGSADHEACISGVCKSFALGVLRCTGCAEDKDCSERKYIGTDCSAPGTRVIVRRSNGYYYGGDVLSFDGPDKGGWGAPNNGNIRVKTTRWNPTHHVSRADVYACKDAPYSYHSSSLPANCKQSCAVSGIQCPLEQPSSPGTEPAACWDGTHKEGNRGVCSHEERDFSRFGPRKWFCREKGVVGAWCGKDEHCKKKGSACDHWRCQKPKPDYHGCNRNAQCNSGHCDLWWGLQKKCRPKEGWKDYSNCVNPHHCKSRKCVHSFGTDKLCMPKIGWKEGDKCTNDAHCRTTSHHAGSCRENGKVDGDCCALKSNSLTKGGSCNGWYSPKWLGLCAGNKYYKYECRGHMYCGGQPFGTCQKKLADMKDCTYNANCQSGHCRHYWGAQHKCEPYGGWPDEKKLPNKADCSYNLECKSGWCKHYWGAWHKCYVPGLWD